jgi:hypothetical protein
MDNTAPSKPVNLTKQIKKPRRAKPATPVVPEPEPVADAAPPTGPETPEMTIARLEMELKEAKSELERHKMFLHHAEERADKAEEAYFFLQDSVKPASMMEMHSNVHGGQSTGMHTVSRAEMDIENEIAENHITAHTQFLKNAFSEAVDDAESAAEEQPSENPTA